MSNALPIVTLPASASASVFFKKPVPEEILTGTRTPLFLLCIPGLPPTTNHAFANGTKGRYMPRDIKAWKQGVKLATLCTRQKPIHGWVEVTLTFYSEKWLTKAGKPRRIDVANLEKLFVDAVFEQLGMEDSHIFKLTLIKRNGQEGSEIRIEPLEEAV